eukprot:5131052-Prymnesium_polylepis.1
MQHVGVAIDEAVVSTNLQVGPIAQLAEQIKDPEVLMELGADMLFDVAWFARSAATDRACSWDRSCCCGDRSALLGPCPSCVCMNSQ